MKKVLTMALGLTLLTGSTMVSSVFAGPKGEELQGRQIIQGNQIQEGVDNGSLTQPEAKQLLKGQQKIDQKAQGALSDDKLSGREFHKLEHMQNKESKDIIKKTGNEKNELPR